MTNAIRGLIFAAVVAAAQAPLTFEVASVRAADRQAPRRGMRAGGEITGGPGTADPERMSYEWCFMSTILQNLFGVNLDRMSNRPDWIGMDRFDIVAKVPPGTTKEQSVEMMKNLLKERFHFAFHLEQKDFDAYDLVVAKGGPKLKEAAPVDGPLPPAPAVGTPAPAPVLDQDGFPVLPAGRRAAQGVTRDSVTRLTFRMSSPAQLGGMLGLRLAGARIADKTGLTGPYDFKLEFSTGVLNVDGNPGAPAPDVFTALEKQLGLKLEKTKIQLDVLTIDHIDRRPTEN
jgi:uncharacterized protein (TIGR03435 family)